MAEGYLALVLHAHLPFVRHPEYETFLEERWLFEAITETYLPLLRVLEGLHRDGVPARMTLSISPTLLAMLEDPLLQSRYDDHLGRLLTLSERELERTRHDPATRRLATFYRELFAAAREAFRGYGGRLSRPLLALHRQGYVELISTAATHGILPLLLAQPRTVEAQIRTGFDYFADVFGFPPSGMWLPECAYVPALDEILQRHGVRHFVVEAHGIDHASVAPLSGIHAPIYTPGGIAAFGRDQVSTREVWSAEHGYPGDPDYREFYRDIGFDLAPESLQGVLGGGVGRAMTGIKYHRITGKTEQKELYDPEAGRRRAELHAALFLRRRSAHLARLQAEGASAPVIVAPFDAELFGHWWFEGPQWLDALLRGAATGTSPLSVVTLGGYLDRHPVHQTGQPGTSSWGAAGYFDTWLNPKTDWIYEHLIGCAERMEGLVAAHGAGRVRPLVQRALRQCVRELLLAQSSDWPFIISAGTAAAYAERRVRDHVSRFHWLANAIDAGALDEERLAALEYLDNPFPAVDFRVFAAPRSRRGRRETGQRHAHDLADVTE